MGYDLHITRADDWSESETRPILLSEWEAYVQTDPALEITGFAEATTPNGETIRVEEEGLAVWNISPEHTCWFGYSDGQIEVRNPNDTIVAKMQQIAAALGARVQGDDGEYYD